MFVLRLRGALGNQMFQYALAKSLLLRTRETVFLDSTFSHYRSETKRRYALDCFQLDREIKPLTTSQLPRVFREPASDLLKKLFLRLRLRGLFTQGWQEYFETNPVYDKAVFDLKSPAYLEGYWQSEKYFLSYRAELLADFSLVKTSPSFDYFASLIKASQSISLHVRRGDYLSNPSASAVHSLCSLEYYQAAIALIKERVKQPKFFIFSDDPTWVKDNLLLSDTDSVIVSSPDSIDPEELILMSLCEHQIIANSSFSWWSAWLNTNPDKIVITPAAWFKNQPRPQDLIPATWLTL